MESKKRATAKNMLISIIYQFVTIVLGFIIPQLFLKTYGPQIHGLTSSITNLMSYVLLLNAGLNTASVQALYEPLSKKDFYRLNAILNAIKNYYINTGILFTVVIIVISFILPLFIQGIPSETVSILMLIMGLQSVVDCFLVSKYRILLQADQKLYVYIIISIVTLILRGIIQIYLISTKASVILVQAVPTIALFITWLLQFLYTNSNYPMLNKKIKPDKKSLSKRWSAFVHQITGLVVNNVDIFILTLSGNMILVSIYSVYQMIFTHLNNMMTNVFSQGVVASFGHIMISKDITLLRKNFNLYEFIYFIIITFVYSVCAVMILPFIELYTEGINEVNYTDPLIALMFLITALLSNYRVPGLMLINAGGLYQETKMRAIIEAIIKFITSIIFFYIFDIYGLLLGSILSFSYRLIDVIIFSNKKILVQSPVKTFYRISRSIIIISTCIVLYSLTTNLFSISNWLDWVYFSMVVTMFAGFMSLSINLIEFNQIREMFTLIKRLTRNKNC